MMKKLWWLGLMVFVLGVGTGVGLFHWQDPQEDQLPVFSQQMTLTQLETIPTQSQAEEPMAAIPCKLQYTSLEVRGLISYDGPYTEDGTDDAVMDVAALVLCNTGTIGIEYVQIVVFQEGRELSFDATFIPPKGTVLILESNREPFSDSPIEECRCRTLIPGNFDWAEDQVSVESSGLGSMEVTNLTQTALSCIRIYYKQYDGQSDMCLGGITYSTVITDLQPGKKVVISPYHYAVDYGQVVAVVVEQ